MSGPLTTDEHEPLLRHHASPATPVQQQCDNSDDNRTTTQRLAIAIPCLILLWCLECGSSLIVVPLNGVLEDNICKNIYPGLNKHTTDPRCKDAAVQSRLTFILGWWMTFSLLPGLFTTVAWGAAADKYGRKPVLALANIGIVLNFASVAFICRHSDEFPIQLIWASCIFYFIGGGSATYSALIFTMASDLSTQAQRSTAFFYLGSAATVGTVVAGPLTYFIIEQCGPWFSMYCGIGLLVLTIPMTIVLPETRSQSALRRANLANKSKDDDRARASFRDIWPLFDAALDQIRVIVRIMFTENATVGVLLFSTVFTLLGSSVVLVILQYAAKRFSWSWSKAGLLLTVKGVSSLVTTAMLLPTLSQLLLSKVGMVPVVKDWWIVRGSAVISALAFLVMGLAPTPPFFIAGLVFSELAGAMYLGVRSMLTELVDPTHTALLMTVSGVFMIMSELLAGPLLALLFRAGMGLGGMWLGLPFFVAAAMLGISATLVISVPIGRMRT